MLHRVIARLRFTKASGMAPWAHAQMAVRHGMAVHINEGEDNAEPKYNEVIDEGSEQILRCNLPLLNEAHAADAYATLTVGSVWAWLSAPHPGETLFVEHHTCGHDETPHVPCAVVARKESVGTVVE